MGSKECSERVASLNRVVRKDLMHKRKVEKRSEGSEILFQVDIHERSGPGREDPVVRGCLMCFSDSQGISVLGST